MIEKCGLTGEHDPTHRRNSNWIRTSCDCAEAYIVSLERKLASLERVRYQAEVVAYNVAGTEGTKTNAELPKWFALRLKDLQEALDAHSRMR